MAQNGKAMPNLDQHRTKLLNLTVLHRIDPFVEDILITAAHVTLYQFNLHINQWGRKDVEGSLFVVKRNAHPRFQFLVMNRRSTDNLVEDLLGDFEYEVQTPYLLYRNAAQEVNGIWFYHSQDCEAVANLFSRILNTFSRIPPKPKVPSTKSNEFEELEAVPSLHVIEGPLEPPRSSTATSVPDVPDSSFVHFFSAATNIGNAPNVTIIEKRKPSSATIPLPSQAPDAISPPVPILQSSNSVSTSSTPLMPILDTQESSSSNDQSANLVKPSFFSPPSSSLMMPQVSSSVPTALPLQSPLTMQRPYRSPLIPLVVPPSPPPYLAPVPTWPLVTKEQIRKALVHLVQNNQFIDMVYREILTANNP